jgi:hypothetical protein
VPHGVVAAIVLELRVWLRTHGGVMSTSVVRFLGGGAFIVAAACGDPSARQPPPPPPEVDVVPVQQKDVPVSME